MREEIVTDISQPTVEAYASTDTTESMEAPKEDQEITETLAQAHATCTDDNHTDTASPLDFCEGQVYVLNKSMQFVRLHTKIGDKFVITSRGLEKIDEDDVHDNQQVLTLKGKFTFTFETK
jgi:hypothetical protein